MDQAAELRQRGVEPWIEKGKANAVQLAHAWLRPEVKSLVRLRKGEDADAVGWKNGARQRLRRRARESDASAFVVSGETFCFLRTKLEAVALRKFLGTAFSEVRPIIVLRNRDDWVASWCAQVEKSGLGDEVAAQPDDTRLTADWYFDAAALEAFWKGIGPTTCIDYDDALRTDGSILPAFLRAIGQDDLPLAKEYWKNPSDAKDGLNNGVGA